MSKKAAVYKPGSGLSPDTESVGSLILDVPASRLWGINVCCLSHPVYGIFAIVA